MSSTQRINSATDQTGAEWIVDSSDLILITGANGFIGIAVLQKLLDYGFQNIRCLARSDNNIHKIGQYVQSTQANVELIRGNLLSRDDCEKAVQNVSLIIHLAAGIGKSFAGCFMNSVVATRNLIEAANEKAQLKRFVSISSVSVYSGIKLHRGETVDETSPIETEHMERFDPYCFGKVKQDELVRLFCEKYGIPYTIVRLGLVYGPGKAAIPGRLGINAFGIFFHIGGSNRLPLIYIDNCAEAIVLTAIRKGIDGEVFLAVDDDLPKSRQFLLSFKNNVREFPSINLPYTMFYIFTCLWEKYSRWSNGKLPPILNRRMCASYFQNQRYTNKKLKKKTGWKPRVSSEEASRRYFEFMKNGV